MSDGIFVSFPGLGIDEFKIKSVAVENLFGVDALDIRWYAIIICTGIILAFLYFFNRAKRTELLVEDDVLNATLIAVPLGIVGARFLYVITNLDDYDTFLEMINIREGGIAIYGGIIFGALALWGYTKFKKLKTLKFFDAICPGVMIGQLIGRWGNFTNGEAYGIGYGVEKLPWRMTVQHWNMVGDEIVPKAQKYITHPTFLYESLWNLLGFVIANVLYKKKKFDGQIFLFYVAWYGLGRGFIEFLREDSLLVFGQKLMVYLGFITCAAAIIVYVLLLRRSKTEKESVEEFLKAKGVVTETGDASTGDDAIEKTESSAEVENDNT